MTAATRKLRKSVNWERSTPRCANCIHYKSGGTTVVDGLRRYYQPCCSLHGFMTADVGLCDTWMNDEGETLTWSGSGE